MADSRINVYHNLSVMLDAGVPITRALSTLYKHGKYGRIFRDIEQEVLQGNSLADAVEDQQKQFQKLDVTLIRVGEETGQISEMLEELSQWYSFRQRMNRTIRSGMVFPIVMIHLAAIVVPVVPFALNGFDVGLYVQGFFTFLAFFYIPGIVILAIIFFSPKRGPLRKFMDFFVLRLPLAGKAIRELELSRYCKVFAITYRAGIPIVNCAQMATDAVSNSIMSAQFEPAAEKARSGQEMSLGFSRSLPLEFINIWQVGEESGQLDDSCWRLSKMHAENAEMRFSIIAYWLPRIFYGIVVGVMIYYIFKGFMQVLGGYSSTSL